MTTLTRSTFAQILFPPTMLTPGREIEVRVMRPERPMNPAADGSPKWSRPQPERREWFGSAEALAGWKAPQDRHVWVAGGVREGRDGTKAGVVASACLWADLDKGGDEALARALAELDRRELLPTLIVRSSPGKHHLWWRLDEPMTLGDDGAKHTFERALVGITALVAGDGAVVDCSRVLRLPGTRNVKPWYGEPPPVEVIEAHPARVHAFARFAELVPPPPTKPAKATKGATKATDTKPGDAAPCHAGLPHLDRCLFVRHCREHAATLPEPLWADLAWTLAPSVNAHPKPLIFARPPVRAHRGPFVGTRIALIA